MGKKVETNNVWIHIGKQNQSIKPNTLQLDFTYVKCRMTNLDTFIKSFELTWVGKNPNVDRVVNIDNRL